MPKAKSVGPVLKVDGEKEYKQAITSINNSMKELVSEMKKSAQEFSDNAKGLKSLKEQTRLSAEAIELQKEKITKLKEALEHSAKTYGENDEKTKKWRISLNNAETELMKMEKELKALSDSSTGIAKISAAFKDVKSDVQDLVNKIPGVEKGKKAFGDLKQLAGETHQKMEPLANGLKKVASAAGDVAKVSLKAFGTGIAAAAAGIVKLGKDSLTAYADMEQLKGGVETLFKGAANDVIKNANDAFKTAGLSANAYMENVTSFSASLISSVGGDTKKAAELADQAIIDMSDNANKMGTDISSIQNAYQGFAKGTFTMLDNLKLGYGGTQEEMKRLLADAEKLTGKKFDISNFADITEAIHAIQTQYGITGTTAKEASSTIQGSISAAKSAFKNLLAGLSDENADLDQLLGNMIESAFTVAKNVVPRIKVFLKNTTEALKEYAPELISELVTGIVENLQPLIEAATAVISALATSLTNEDNLQLIIQSAVDLVIDLVDAIVNNITPIIDAAFTIITSLVDALLEDDNLTKLIDAAIELTTSITTGLLDHIPELVHAGFQLIGGLVKGLWDNRGKIWDSIKQICKQLIQTVIGIFDIHSPSKVFADIGKNLILGLINGIENAKQWVFDKIRGLGSSIIQKAEDVLGINSPSKEFEKLGDFTGQGFGIGFVNSMKKVRQQMKDAIPTDLKSDVGVKLQTSVEKVRNKLSGDTAQTYGGTPQPKSNNTFNFNISVNVSGNTDKTNIAELAEAVADRIYRETKAKLEAFA